jgi:hypothetical protein
MGTDDIHKRKKTRALSELRRSANKKQIRELILIVCEGSKTEPNYFKGFQLTNVDVHGTGSNTLSVVQKAIDLKREARKMGKIYDQVWCVFDRDSFTPARFNDALQLANNNSFSVAYSNEAFELWYILHYEYLQSALSRYDYIDRLSELLGYRYVKKTNPIYMRNC